MPPRPQTDALRGSLDLLVLKTLSLAPMHGWGIGQRVQQLSKGTLEEPTARRCFDEPSMIPSRSCASTWRAHSGRS